MADYYSLIKKAVARLDLSASRESRQAIYERARSAQLAQLRSISPSLSEAEITGEQMALEEAVRRIETEVSPPAHDVRAPANIDLLVAADEIGKPIVRPKDRSSIAQAKAFANTFSPGLAVEIPLPMMVCGGATGRLISYWRFRSAQRQGVR